MARALDEWDEDAAEGGARRWLPLAVIALVIAGVGYWLYLQASGAHGVKVEAPPPIAVNMLPPPPPPPPPPPKPEPPKPTDAPNPTPNPDPPKAAPAPMQINGPAQAGTDAFGLGAGSGGGMGAPASTGQCITADCGKPAGGGGISDAFYTRYLAGTLQERVLGSSKVNRLAFQAGFAIKIEGGRVVSAQLTRSTGKPDLDAQLRSILEETAGLTAPPAGWNGRAREITVRGRRPV